jgi:hypothetical protein
MAANCFGRIGTRPNSPGQHHAKMAQLGINFLG